MNNFERPKQEITEADFKENLLKGFGNTPFAGERASDVPEETEEQIRFKLLTAYHGEILSGTFEYSQLKEWI